MDLKKKEINKAIDEIKETQKTISFKYFLINFTISVLALIIAFATNSVVKSVINKYAPDKHQITSYLIYMVFVIIVTFIVLGILYKIFPTQIKLNKIINKDEDF